MVADNGLDVIGGELLERTLRLAQVVGRPRVRAGEAAFHDVERVAGYERLRSFQVEADVPRSVTRRVHHDDAAAAGKALAVGERPVDPCLGVQEGVEHGPSLLLGQRRHTSAESLEILGARLEQPLFAADIGAIELVHEHLDVLALLGQER